MVYYDIHTHHLPVHPEDAAIVNSLVPTFDVETGLFRSVGIHPWYIYNVEEQLAELKRAEESRQAWRQYIASLKEMINPSAAQE